MIGRHFRAKPPQRCIERTTEMTPRCAKVIVAAISPTGSARILITVGLRGELRLFFSDDVFEETERNLHYDVSGRLPEIRVPALVVCGRQDPIVAVPELCAEIHRGIPHAELLMLEHSGHGVDPADVGLFRETVLRFLAAVEEQPAP